MPNIDSEQVRLRLTNQPSILAELRRKGRLVRVDGEEAFQVQFDSHTFTFKKDSVITIGRTVANCLLADASVIVGPPIDGEVHPVLDEVGSFDASKGEVKSATACPVCGKETGSIKKLVEHIALKHVEQEPKPNGKASAKGHPTAGAAGDPSAELPPPNVFESEDDGDESANA